MAAAPLPGGAVRLTPRAEQEFRREAERVGGYEVDRDQAETSSAAHNFLADCHVILEAVRA